MSGTPLPTVAIVGRPNVGKSTLFNRLVGKRRAITSPVAGTTRDRITEEASWNGRVFRLMDTGGLDIPDPENVIEQHVVRHAEQAIASANLLLFVVDASQPLGLLDRRAADRLRRAKVPVLLVANKAERLTEADVSELYSLGLGEPMLVSSMVGTGTGDLLDALVARLDAPREGERERHPRIALVGRPNVGKSSLLNAITGEERAIVSNIPGTTRDAVDTELVFQGTPLTLLDTAGIRRRGKLDTALEHYSVDRAQRAIEGADVAVLVLDAHESIAHQDQVITSVAIEAGVGLVIAANKSDLLSDEEAARERILRALHREFIFLPWAPVVFTSATEGQNIDALLETALQCATARSTFVDQEDLASYIRRATLAKPPPLHGGKAVKITSLQQTGIRPPTFAVTIRGTAELHFSYRRFLERLIRERYGFQGTPIRLHFHTEKR